MNKIYTVRLGLFLFFLILAVGPANAITESTEYQYRQKITITTGSAALPSSYSVNLAFNHASLVSNGKSQADGDDVRVFYWNGSAMVELDRALDVNSTWNKSATKIWFTTQAAIGASTTDGNYYLYYGNLTVGNPPTINRKSSSLSKTSQQTLELLEKIQMQMPIMTFGLLVSHSQQQPNIGYWRNTT